MDLKQIKELIAAMEKGGIHKLIVKEKGGFEVHLEKQEKTPPPKDPTHYPHLSVQPPVTAPHKQEAPVVKEQKEQEGRFITSPMVGTFYSSPSPDDPPFVKVGDKVTEGSVVCIVEAMKVMNEVKAGISGTVAEILSENGKPVEFGTKIFRIQ